MTITTPTGELLTDLAIFCVFFIVAFAIVWVGSEIEIRKERRKK